MKLFKITLQSPNSTAGFLIRAVDEFHAKNIIWEQYFYGVMSGKWILTSSNVFCQEVSIEGDPEIILSSQ